MRIEVLVAAMNQADTQLLQNMNIQTDAIVGNQCNTNEVKKIEWGRYQIKWLSFNERGVGLNRNNALMRATGDICLFADDDMVYVDGYADIVKKAFEQIPDADVIVFNLKEKIPTRYVIPKIQKVSWLNYLRYGTARIAVKLPSVKQCGIYFNQCFGGGTEYSHGEDNLFLTGCLRNGLKVYAYPAYIARLTEKRESTWETKNIGKYLNDQGVLYHQISRRYWRFLCFQDAVRRCKTYGMSWREAYNIMIKR